MVLAATVCVTSATLLAQQKFTSTTSLLTLDVSVLDRDGNPVTGLGPDDFVVTLNKETQPVRTMVFLATQSRSTTKNVRVPSPRLPQSPPPAAAADASREPDPKLLVIMVDDMSIYPTDSKGLFVAAERFIDTIPARDWVGLTSTSGRMTVNRPRAADEELEARLRIHERPAARHQTLCGIHGRAGSRCQWRLSAGPH